ncbi:hypothetical protein C8R46DRAFT_1107957 [Mycena filopes]|nr:hypothetical protein C8R46DRAFT_1107957 [Mycena filopes]
MILTGPTNTPTLQKFPACLSSLSSLAPFFGLFQERASDSGGSSAGVTVGATIGAILLLALVLFLFFFFKRNRDSQQGSAGHNRNRNAPMFDSGPDESKTRLMSQEKPSSRGVSMSPAPPRVTQFPASSRSPPAMPAPILTSPPTDERPQVPRLTIPPSAGAHFMQTVFTDAHAESAVSSACMDSADADSAYSQFSAAGQSGVMHSGPSRHFPIFSGPEVVVDPSGSGSARPGPRRSLHPIAGMHPHPVTTRMRMDSIMELPSPYVFAPMPLPSPPSASTTTISTSTATHDYRRRSTRDSIPVSPMSKLSEELDSFIDHAHSNDNPEEQWPETPASAAYSVPTTHGHGGSGQGHVSPLSIRKNAA